ncbi:hypothetical protein SprV_0802480500 [Sparganum proliferum]
MFIASILPALFACVLGADVPVWHLAQKLNISLPFIGLRKPHSVLHGNAVIQEGSKSTSCKTDPYVSVLHLAPNTAFTLTHVGLPRPQSVIHGNAAIREGSTSHPCEVGEPCYQSLTSREYALAEGYRAVGKGIIVAYPVDKTKSPSAIIVQKKGDTSADPAIPVRVGVTERIELNTPNSGSVVIWYADRVQDTRLSGNIEFAHSYDPSANSYAYLAPYLYEWSKETPSLILTGRLENTAMEYKLMFSKSDCVVLRLVPSDHPDPFPTTIRVAFSGVHHLKPWKVLLCLLPAIITTAMP